MFDFNEWAKDPKNEVSGNGGYRLLKKIVCKDGFSISVQASGCHYCSPQKVAPTYDLVECGYPTHHLSSF